jgi:uncharacterized delta-60 repeat protein
VIGRRPRRAGWAVFVVAAGLLPIAGAAAAPGDLDASFGDGGIVRTRVGQSFAFATAAAQQTDGKLVAAGGSMSRGRLVFTLTRYLEQGALDRSFGRRGKVTTGFGPDQGLAMALAVQEDGKLVVGGSVGDNGAADDFALTRYLENGSLDASFGNGGIVITPVGSSLDDAYALALQHDGKLVAAGTSVTESNADFALVRYRNDGSLDPSFGDGGKVVTALGPLIDIAFGVVVQPDGKLVAAGLSGLGGGSDPTFALVRYRKDGSLDRSFGSRGIVTTAVGSEGSSAYALVLQPDGKLVAAGLSDNASGSDVALARYRKNGSLDPTFGEGGKVITPVGNSIDTAKALALQSDGKLVAVGRTVGDDGRSSFALVRYLADGSLDGGFGDGGKVVTDAGTVGSSAEAVTVQRDGKLVAAGVGSNQTRGYFALARYDAG